MKYTEYEIEKLNIAVIDGDRGKNYPHQDELLDMGECVFLSANNVTQMGFKFDSVMFITKEKDNILRKGKLQRNDIVITTRGTIGNVAFYDDSVYFKDMRINSGMLIVRCFEGVDSEYLYNVFRSIQFQKQIKQIQTGTAQPQLPKSHFLKMKVILPPIHIQKKITSIIGSIDKKIKYNKKINDNLEQQIITIFDKLFSDLIIDKSLFVPMGEIADFKYGTMPKKDKIQETGYPIFSGYKIVGYYPEKMFENPQLIIVARGVGGCGDVKFTPKDCYLTNLSIAIIPSDLRHELYMFYYLKQQDTKILNTGSAQPQITISSLANYNIPIPNIEDIETFNSFAVPFVEMVRKNEIEIKQLSNLRDFLLPRIMSFYIYIYDINL